MILGINKGHLSPKSEYSCLILSLSNVYTFFKTELKCPILYKDILLPSLILLEDIIALIFVTFILYYINSFK